MARTKQTAKQGKMLAKAKKACKKSRLSNILSQEEWRVLKQSKDVGIRKRAEETRKKFQEYDTKLHAAEQKCAAAQLRITSAKAKIVSSEQVISDLQKSRGSNEKDAQELKSLAQEMGRQKLEELQQLGWDRKQRIEAAIRNVVGEVKREFPVESCLMVKSESPDELQPVVKREFPDEPTLVFKTELEDSSESETDTDTGTETESEDEGSVVIKAEEGTAIKAEEGTAIKVEPRDGSDSEEDTTHISIKAEDY